MKQITTITAIFLINGLCLSSAAADKPIPFAGGLNQGGNEEKKEFGAPNKVSEEGQSEEKQGRIANRQPNPHLGRGGEESEPETGGGRKTQDPNDKKELTRPAVVPKGGPLYNDPEVAEAIGLTEQQAEELRKVHEFAIKRCGEVMGNKKLTEEQKQREIEAIKRTQKARRAEILTAEQLAALEKLHKGAKEYEEQQAGKKGSKGSGKPRKPKGHFSQVIRRSNQDSKGAKRIVSVASVLGGENEKEIIKINERFRGQLIEASQSCHSQILALEESTKAAILAIKQDPELEAEDKKLQIAEIKAEAEMKKAEIIAEMKEKCGTAEIERGTALGEQLNEEEYEALREIRVHNTSVRQQRTERREEKPKQKGGTDSKGRPEKGGTDSKGRPEKGGGSEQVILYTTRGCGYCTKAANLLKSKGIDFVNTDIGVNRKAYEEVAQKTKKAGIKWSGGVPVTDARGKIIVGYNESALARIQKRP